MPATLPHVDGARLREVMRHVASPVTVVTATVHGEPRGATIGSFTSVSLEPPLISFNVTIGSQLHETLVEGPLFAVHLLGEDQADLSVHFALPDRSSAEQFGSLVYTLGVDGQPPLLAHTLGVLLCRPYTRFDAGDHTVFVGEVVDIVEGHEGRPLLYYARSYRTVSDPA